ncbi:MAG TPA: SDR family NAD(P)-dependent oxidoreductase [Solimonas sp.]|nr:SDR family NAD(P)-dependent oxidoreductase [Solimonas sp.]
MTDSDRPASPPPAPAGCALVVGVGGRVGIGAAVAKRFATEGLHVHIVGRTAAKLDEVVANIVDAGGKASAIVNTLGSEREVAALFEALGSQALDAVVYNAAFKNVPRRFLTTPPAFIEDNWQLSCIAGLMVGQAALRRMQPQGRGTLIVTGATASLRGKPAFAAFASAKAGLRSWTLALAREAAPLGIHVAHAVIDGVVAGDRVKETGGGLGRLLVASRGKDGALLPEQIADNYWQLHAQPRGAWTRELDLRPWKENF